MKHPKEDFESIRRHQNAMRAFTRPERQTHSNHFRQLGRRAITAVTEAATSARHEIAREVRHDFEYFQGKYDDRMIDQAADPEHPRNHLNVRQIRRATDQQKSFEIKHPFRD